MPAKKKTRKKPATGKSRTSKKSGANKRKAALKSAKRRKKATAKTAARTPAKRTRKRSRPSAGVSRARPPIQSGEQSGDLQGLSRVESADSESVDELLEEGNAFEADVVKGVEAADEEDEKEVRTHEVPEDDVPGEYLDED
jgi:hypothetical protein